MTTETVYVKFLDSRANQVIGIFGSPQDPDLVENYGEVQDDDPRYMAFFQGLNGNVPPTEISLCVDIDTAADAARMAVAGDPLRAMEYEKAATEAQAFKDAGYPANSVPRTVAAWAINGRTHQESADGILSKAAAYNDTLYRLREMRLAAKEQIRALIAAGTIDQAKAVATDAVALIESMVKGVDSASTSTAEGVE